MRIKQQQQHHRLTRQLFRNLCVTCILKKPLRKCIINILLSRHPTNVPELVRIKKKGLTMVGSSEAESRVVESPLCTTIFSFSAGRHKGRQTVLVGVLCCLVWPCDGWSLAQMHNMTCCKLLGLQFYCI